MRALSIGQRHACVQRSVTKLSGDSRKIIRATGREQDAAAHLSAWHFASSLHPLALAVCSDRLYQVLPGATHGIDMRRSRTNSQDRLERVKRLRARAERARTVAAEFSDRTT